MSKKSRQKRKLRASTSAQNSSPSAKHSSTTVQKKKHKEKTSTTEKDSGTGKIILNSIMVFVFFLLIGAVGVLGVYYYYLDRYEHTFYPGVHIADFDLSGMTYDTAFDLLDERVRQLEEEGLLIQFQEAQTASLDASGFPTLNLTSVVVPFDASGYDREVFSIDFQSSLDVAYAVGREGARVTQVKEQLSTWLYGHRIEIEYLFDHEYVQELLKQSFSQYESPATNANIVIDAAGTIELTNEQLGRAFDFEAMTKEVDSAIQHFSINPIIIKLETDYPEVTIDDIQSDLVTVKGYIAQAPITLEWKVDEDTTEQWKFNQAALGSWLSFKNADVSIDPKQLKESLADVAAVVNTPAQEARWEVEKDEGGALIGIREFQASKEGRAIDYGATAKHIDDWLKKNSKDSAIAIAIKVDQPRFTPDNINELGIKDLLGTGHSNMRGSPYNRQRNIARGVELLNGLLVPAEETFSLIDALTPFTEENGYVPELVIKGNETKPEVGGGLCQIGTTTFRAAMGAGLDIISRQNHSYAVSYYSDDRNGLPGTDATIYEPAPDFSFYNDTPGYILLQTRIEGYDLYFDFWGIRDGRVAEFTPPTTSNWIQPPPLKEIESTDLAPGERKCTESAHAGVTAVFTYIVDYADGTHHEEEFRSVYKPWQAVCLIGVEKLSEEKEEEEVTEPTSIGST